MILNPVQKAAYELIQADARFLYTLTVVHKNYKNINSNYIMMSQPYIGLFADGAEQWCKKVRLTAPRFNEEEKKYYIALRQKHKMYELSYLDCFSALNNLLHESDEYFYCNRSPLEKLVGYYNVGTDLCEGEFCGNTILCALYSPFDILKNEDTGPRIRDISVVAGKLAAFFGCTDYVPFRHNDNINVNNKDYHFYNNCPIGNKTGLGFLLFSVLCSVNYAIKFIDRFFVDEIPQKFKCAYLQYYYLCSFVSELNMENDIDIFINKSLRNGSFRNCLAHYGLGQYLSESDLCPGDPLKGLTKKAFNIDYFTAKEKLYNYLEELTEQIKVIIRLK